MPMDSRVGSLCRDVRGAPHWLAGLSSVILPPALGPISGCDHVEVLICEPMVSSDAPDTADTLPEMKSLGLARARRKLLGRRPK